MARRRNNGNKQKGNSAKEQFSGESKERDEGTTGSKDEKSKSTNDIPSSRNDPEWYCKDPQLAVDGASIPYSTPFGGKIEFWKNRNGVAIPGSRTLNANYADHSIPGICTVLVKPTVGASGDKTSPINVCANALYAHVRYINSGRKNYDPADIMLYVLAFGDIYAYVSWLIRLYNYAFMYSQRNWYIGKDLIEANGVDPDDIISNLANFRYWINSIVNKISSFALPGDIYYFKRRVFLFANYYIENPYGNLKDQLYQFVPDGFYSFGLDTNHGAGKLEYAPLFDHNGSLRNIAYLQAYFEQILMGNITGDEDFGLMSGDIYKSYGENILRLSSIGEEGGLLPVHDPYVLSQFKNATVTQVIVNNTVNTYKDHNGDTHIFGDVEQTTDGLLVCSEAVDWANKGPISAIAAADRLVTVETPSPNVGDTLEATRLMPFLGLYPNWDGTYFYAWNGGTEIPIQIRITYAPHDGAGAHIITGESGTSITNSTVHVNEAAIFQAFKYSPTRFGVTYVNTNELSTLRVLSNVDNTTLIDNRILMRIHEIALLSLFFVPGVAKIV